MDRTLSEAQGEIRRASTWGRKPAAWATELVAEAAGGPDPLTLFLEAGFCEEDAARGVRRLEGGNYLGFADAALAMRRWGGAAFNSRSPRATEARILEVANRHPAPKLVVERRTELMVRPRLVESGGASLDGTSIFEGRLITAGQGSSGFYPAATLERAAKEGVFGAGLHCYIDHPTWAQDQERPERSVRDLAGYLEESAVYRDGGLEARIRVLAPFRQHLAEAAPVIGLSIRADAEVSEKTAPGRQGPTIEHITRAHSVDFVTHAGRGGRFTANQ